MRTIAVKKNFKLAKFTPIAIAEDREIALECVELLKSHKINARTNVHSTEASPYGVTILVQNKSYNHAFTIIHEKIGPNGFFDTSATDSSESSNPIQSSANPTQAA
jgi:hypothetical protein